MFYGLSAVSCFNTCRDLYYKSYTKLLYSKNGGIQLIYQCIILLLVIK